ncbi:spore coat protein CotJB [Priestia megaterium]
MDNNPKKMFTPVKTYQPFHSIYDPCRPIGVKYYSTPPQLYMGFQPPNLQQFNEYAQQAMQLKRNFETKYGSLQQYGNSYTDGKWSWGTSPWPWQI